MTTHFEEKIIKNKCKELGIDEHKCRALLGEIGKFATINQEAEYWLDDKNKKITEKRVEFLVRECDDAMEKAAEEIEVWD